VLVKEGWVTLVTDGLIVGVDTYKDVHVAVVLDRLGRRLAVREFPRPMPGTPGCRGGCLGSARSPMPG
jgi:hypothetical protein